MAKIAPATKRRDDFRGALAIERLERHRAELEARLAGNNLNKPETDALHKQVQSLGCAINAVRDGKRHEHEDDADRAWASVLDAFIDAAARRIEVERESPPRIRRSARGVPQVHVALDLAKDLKALLADATRTRGQPQMIAVTRAEYELRKNGFSFREIIELIHGAVPSNAMLKAVEVRCRRYQQDLERRFDEQREAVGEE
jgi:hypothetical protein